MAMRAAIKVKPDYPRSKPLRPVPAPPQDPLHLRRVNLLNMGLMLVSCLVAYVVPFELFLFSYAVLGPLHYLTEISWLQKRNYFTQGKNDYLLLTGLCLLTFIFGAMYPKMSSWNPTLVAVAFGGALAM